MKNHLLALSLLFAATSSPSFTTPIHAADASASKIQHADTKAAAKLIETNKELVILDIRIRPSLRMVTSTKR